MSHDCHDSNCAEEREVFEECVECGSEEVGVFASLSGDAWCMPCYRKKEQERERRKAALAAKAKEGKL